MTLFRHRVAVAAAIAIAAAIPATASAQRSDSYTWKLPDSTSAPWRSRPLV